MLVATGRFRGNPIAAHERVPEITPGHFDGWLALFEKVAFQTLPSVQAADIVGRSHRMRAVLERNAGSAAPN